MKRKRDVEAMVQRLLRGEVTTPQAKVIAHEILLHAGNQLSKEFIDMRLRNYAIQTEHQITRAKLEILKWVIGITLVETTGFIGTILAVAQYLR